MLKSSLTTQLPTRLVVDRPPSLAPEPCDQAPAASVHSPPMARWLFPSLTDMIFLVLLWLLAFAPMGAGLLNDADTGWHIRNGQHIMRTLSVPRTDDFSYTMNRKPCSRGNGCMTPG